MIFEISIAIIALAFLGLAIYLILTLVSLKKTLNEVSVLLENLNGKARKTDGLFNALSNVGEYLDDTTEQLSHHSDIYTKKKVTNESPINWIELAAVGLLLWQQIKKKG